MKIAKTLRLLSLPVFSVLIACGGNAESNAEINTDSIPETVEEVNDEHSYSNVNEVNTTHLHLDLNVDFDKKTLKGSVKHDITNTKEVEKMIFDVNDIQIEK